MSAHTPTPWKQASKAHGDEYACKIVAPWDSKTSMVIAKTGPHDPYIPWEVCEANAELIVRAVNSHAALLEACQASEHWLTEEAANPGEATPDEILRVLRAAIGNAAAFRSGTVLYECDRCGDKMEGA